MNLICRVIVYILCIDLTFSWWLDIPSCSEATMTRLESERSKPLFVYAFAKKRLTASGTIDSDVFRVDCWIGLSNQPQGWL
jgi:hypothetical protein